MAQGERKGAPSKTVEVVGRSEIFLELYIGVQHGGEKGYSETGNFIFLPDDPIAWKKRMENALQSEKEMTIAITNLPSSTVGYLVAFFPGVPDTAKKAPDELENGKTFGFITDISTLKALVRALSIAISEDLN